MRGIFFCFLFFAPLCVSARGVLEADTRASEGRKENCAVDREKIYYEAIKTYFGEEKFSGVFKSTRSCAGGYEYLKKGFYRQEMIMLFFIASQSRSSFEEIAEEISGGKTLGGVCSKRNVDFEKIFRLSGKAKEKIDSVFEIKISSAVKIMAEKCEDEKKEKKTPQKKE